MPRKKKETLSDDRLSYLVIFDNEKSIRVYADSKAEAIESALLEIEKITGKNRDEIVEISNVMVCH